MASVLGSVGDMAGPPHLPDKNEKVKVMQPHEIPAHLTAIIDQQHKAAGENLLTHIISACDLMQFNGQAPESVWHSYAVMFEQGGEKYSPREVAQLAAAAVVILAEQMAAAAERGGSA
ncbi:hypothetical protein [Nocardia carnea]|uniref:hypothetical protein n=1 Tax=Nocardia carnea TaxID=37328 RepID=UPI0024580F9C|nr:hypothetical protein [Nocardia carnea]